jgi:L-alanine-DL-glutamate epimerase-like enolase superfamily enzyme
MLESWRLATYSFPTPRLIGDCRHRIDALPIGTLELGSSSGETGLGFFWAPSFPDPLPSLDELEAAFARDVAPALGGTTPDALHNRLGHPRCGGVRVGPFADALDLALWDLRAKNLDLPLYRLLGGSDPRVPAYASGLDFNLSLEETCAFFADAARQGFSVFKVKVGHESLAWELDRLHAISEAVGVGATLLVDANEAWTAKDTIRRLHAYRDAGLHVLWIEDPCPREDVKGLSRVAREVPFAYLQAGEYLDTEGRRHLIESGAIDVVNLLDHVSDGLRLAWLAAGHGTRVAVGNTAFDVGVHLAAALPDVLFVEYSLFAYERFAVQAICCEDGHAVAPDRPGHGITLSEGALASQVGRGPQRTCAK